MHLFKRSVLVSGFILVTLITFSQGTQLEWAVQLGGTDFDHSNAIAVDTNDNVYTTGYFKGTIDLDPGAGTLTFTEVANRDIFISKLDKDGNLVWGRAFGGTGLDEGYAIFADDSGNVYTTGYFTGTVDFDPGAALYTLTSTNYSWDIFILKLDVNGDFVWARRMGGKTSNDLARGITVDSIGNVYTTGFFLDTADFDPGVDTFNLISSGEDIFISKLDVNGNFLWAKKIGGLLSYFDEGYGITLDEQANVYTVGVFAGTSDFDPGPGTFFLSPASNGSNDIYISKLDANGNFIWAKKMGGSGMDYGKGIRYRNGNIYLAGDFTSTADFDPGAGVFNLSAIDRNIFIAKIDTNGNFVWAKGTGSTSGGTATILHGMDVDVNGTIYATGSFDGTTDLNPGPEILWFNNLYYEDIFVLRLNDSGQFEWGKMFSGTDTEEGMDVCAGKNEFVFATGYFYGSVDFDPSGSVFNLTSFGTSSQYCDVYVSKFQVCTVYGIDVLNSCGPLTWLNGYTYNFSNSNGQFLVEGGAVNGCDSIIELNLTVQNIDNGITQTGITLTSDDASAAHQWLDCSNGFAPISGETGVSFTPAITGNYAVQVINGLCTDTSACTMVTVAGIGEPFHLQKYPIKAYNVLGQEVPLNSKYLSIIIYSDGTRAKSVRLVE